MRKTSLRRPLSRHHADAVLLGTCWYVTPVSDMFVDEAGIGGSDEARGKVALFISRESWNQPIQSRHVGWHPAGDLAGFPWATVRTRSSAATSIVEYLFRPPSGVKAELRSRDPLPRYPALGLFRAGSLHNAAVPKRHSYITGIGIQKRLIQENVNLRVLRRRARSIPRRPASVNSVRAQPHSSLTPHSSFCFKSLSLGQLRGLHPQVIRLRSMSMRFRLHTPGTEDVSEKAFRLGLAFEAGGLSCSGSGTGTTRRVGIGSLIGMYTGQRSRTSGRWCHRYASSSHIVSRSIPVCQIVANRSRSRLSMIVLVAVMLDLSDPV